MDCIAGIDIDISMAVSTSWGFFKGSYKLRLKCFEVPSGLMSGRFRACIDLNTCMLGDLVSRPTMGLIGLSMRGGIWGFQLGLPSKMSIQVGASRIPNIMAPYS